MKNWELSRLQKGMVSLMTAASLIVAVGVVFYANSEIPETSVAEGIEIPRLTWKTRTNEEAHLAEINFDTDVVTLVGGSNVEVKFEHPEDLDAKVITSFENQDTGTMTLVIPETWVMGATEDGILVRNIGNENDIMADIASGGVMLSISGTTIGGETSYDTLHFSGCEPNLDETKRCSVTVLKSDFAANDSTLAYVVSADGLKNVSDYFTFVGFNSDSFVASNPYSLRFAVGERLFTASNSTQREAAWSVIVRTFSPYVNYWPYVDTAGVIPTDKAASYYNTTDSIHNQYLCHADYASDKVPWNLEPGRPNIGYGLSMLLASCNPTW